MIKTLRYNFHPLQMSNWACFFCLVFLVSASTLRAQDLSTYDTQQAKIGTTVDQFTFLTSPTDVAIISNTTTVPLATVQTDIPIGFPFVFNSQTFTTFHVYAKGYIAFGSTYPATNVANPINSDPASDYNIISPFAANYYYPQNAAQATNNPPSIGYELDATGGVGNRILKVEWKNLAPYWANTVTDLVSFQVWLYENDNRIEFYIKAKGTGMNSGVATNACMGIRSGINSQSISYRTTGTTTAWNTVTPGNSPFINTTSNSAVSLGGANAANTIRQVNAFRKYSFIPKNCLVPTNLDVASASITSNGFTLEYTYPNPAPTNGVDYEVVNSSNVVVSSGNSTASPIIISGLAAEANYIIRLRSNCGTGYSDWTADYPVRTLCGVRDIPYYLGFNPVDDNFLVPGIPQCSTRQTITGGTWGTVSNATAYGFTSQAAVYNGSGTVAANAWLYTGGINLVAGQAYRMSFKTGGDAQTPSIVNRLRVAYGTSRTPSAMTNEVVNLPTIRLIEESVSTFVAPTTGVYYFGFQAYSSANMGRLFVDDILIEESQCYPPTTFEMANLGSFSGMVIWNTPINEPAVGYEYYLSTSNTAPTSTTLPTALTGYQVNLASLTGLTPNTTYYIWVRSKCGTLESSMWSQMYSFTTMPGIMPATCNPAPTSVDGQGITNVSVGTINNTTGIEAGNYGNYTHLSTDVPIGDEISVFIRFQTNSYDYNCRIWVDWNNNGTFEPTEHMFYAMSYATATSTVEAIFTIPNVPLGEYRMRIGGADINNLSTYGAGQGPCYTGSFGTFEDYTLKVVPARLPLAIDQISSAQCAGTPSVTVNITPETIGNYQVFEWSPANGVSGNAQSGFTFSNANTTVYTLTAYQTAPPFNSNRTSFTYLATEVPTAITITPSASNLCPQGTPVRLTATGGVISGISAREQNFNGFSSGAVTLDADWVISGVANAGRFTVRQDSYNPGNANAGIVRSPDQSNFLIANSDGTGSGVGTNTKLTTTVNLGSFTTSMLSFSHVYQRYLNCDAKVNIRGRQTVSSPFSAWQTVLHLTTQTVGTKTNFVFQQIDISQFAGFEVVEIEFHYVSTWGWHWALDDIKISGSAESTMTWSPLTDLYVDAAGTIPYTGQGLSEVYALPQQTQTYTATATSSGVVSCETTQDITLNVFEIDPGTLPDALDICDGIIPNIPLVDYEGEIIGWEKSTSPDFTSSVVYVPNSDGVDVMTSAILGPVTSTVYLRALVETSYCTSASLPVHLRVETTNWNGTAWSNGAPTASKMVVFNGNYTSTGDLTACGVVVNSGSVTFNAGHTLTAVNAVTVMPSGTLTFENNASLVQVNDASVNTGNIVYKRNTTPIRRFDYTYWSSPVSPLTLANVSPNTLADKYFEFNTVVGDWSMVPSSTAMVKGKGYIIRGPQNFSTSTFAVYNATLTGVPNNGVVTRPITFGGSDLNLLGNPYPSAIDADQLLLNYAVNSNVLAGTLYFWTHNTNLTNNNYDVGDYATYTLTGGVSPINPGNGNSNEPDGFIAAGQGFFANATTTGGSITLNNSYRVGGNNARFYRVAESTAPVSFEKNRYWIGLKSENESLYRQVLVGYVSQATNGKDAGFDGDLLNSNEALQVYTLIDSDKMAIQGRSLPFDLADSVPVGFNVSEPGSYTFEWVKHDGLFTQQLVYIEDLYTGTITPLTANSAYSFTTLAGEFNDRFVFRYTNQTLGNGNWEHANDLIAFRSNDGIQVKSTSAIIQSVFVYDLQGRLLASAKQAQATTENWLAIGATQQVVLVVIDTPTGEKITRKVTY